MIFFFILVKYTEYIPNMLLMNALVKVYTHSTISHLQQWVISFEAMHAVCYGLDTFEIQVDLASHLLRCLENTVYCEVIELEL